MKFFLRATAFLCTTTTFAAVPPNSIPSIDDLSTPVAGSTGPENVTVYFSVPCKDCFPGGINNIDLRLRIPATNLECTSSSPALNDVVLHQDNASLKGTLTIKTTLPNDLGERDVQVSWEKACIDGKATLLSAKVHNSLGHAAPTNPSGFAISFTQSLTPKVLRLQDHPVQNVNVIESIIEWLQPAEMSPVNFKTQPCTSVPSWHNLLALEYDRLEQLKTQLDQLYHEVAQQERRIFVLLKDDLKRCRGIKCYFEMAIKKIPEFFQLASAHFHDGLSDKTSPCTWFKATERPSLPESSEYFHHGLLSPPPPPPAPLSDLDAIPLPPRPHHQSTPPPDFGLKNDMREGSDEHFKDDHPHPHHDGPPEGHHHDQHPQAPFNGPPPHEPPHHFGHPPHRRPPIQHPAPRHPRFRLIIAMVGFLAVSVILSGLFIFLRIYLSNPRVQADRAARQEECRTKRAYRRAACKYRFNQMFSRFRRRNHSPEADCEEKRKSFRSRRRGRSNSDGIMRADINSLRRAQELVGELMRAEEGRARLYQEANYGSSAIPTNVTNEVVPTSAQSVASVSTLPPYVPPPPRYSQELSRDMEVVDGFSYTPSHSNATSTSSSSFLMDDDMTDSSVADCRSRMSLETESAPRSRKSFELAGDRMRRFL